MGTNTSRLRTSRWRRHPHPGAFCLFLFVIGGLYWPVIDGARSLVTNGPWTQPVFVVDALGGGPIPAPLTRLAATSWAHLQLPVVDPFQGFGIPLLSNQGVALYPPELLAHLLFPSNYSVWMVVNLVALAFGVYLLARAFGVGFFGATAAGFLAALAGAVPPNLNNAVPNTLAVLPFVLLAVRFTVDPASEHRVVAMLGVATSVALMCLSGFPELLPLMAIVIVVYTVALIVHYRTWRVNPRVIAACAGAALGGAAIGCIGIFPTLSDVDAGASVNKAGSHLLHAPAYWLSTLTLPTITRHAMNGAPQSLGNAVYTLGTPLFVLVGVLAFLIALRRGGEHTRWYVFSSLVLVLLGVLAYADTGGILRAMGLPLLDRVDSMRFVQFAWWIPLCLLLGAVVTNARVLLWKDALVGLAAAAAFDAYFSVRFRQALHAAHVPGDGAVSQALLVAGAVLVVFVGAILSVRRIGPGAAGLLMAVLVLASCIYDLPTNLAPGRDGGVIAALPVAGDKGSSGNDLALFGRREQLPTTQYSVQLWGPLVPRAYRVISTRLFSKAQAGGLSPLFLAAPTLSTLEWTPRAVSVLRSLGVNLLVLPSPLAARPGAPVPTCAQRPSSTQAGLCFLGREPTSSPGVGLSPRIVYAYRVRGADPLVVPTATPVPVGSTRVATRILSRTLSPSVSAMTNDAYVTTDAAHLHAARRVRGISRHADTEQVSIALDASSAGIAVLRESYERGMHATVNGHSTPAMPVDGGLWTALDVGSGTSHVVLDYVTTADLIELGIGAAGLAVLALGFLALLGLGWRQRRLRAPVAPHPLPGALPRATSHSQSAPTSSTRRSWVEELSST